MLRYIFTWQVRRLNESLYIQLINTIAELSRAKIEARVNSIYHRVNLCIDNDHKLIERLK